MGETIKGRWKRRLDRIPLWSFWIPPSVLILGTLPIDRKLAAGLFWTFLQGESAITHWLRHGYSFRGAVAIATACSTYDLFFWFICFNRLEDFIKKFFKVDIGTLETEASTLAYFYRWLKKWKFLYLSLFLFGCIPGLVWTGIGLGQALRLNQPISFLIMAIGNFFKMLGFGHLAKKIGLIGIIAVLVVFALLKLFGYKIWRLNHKKK